MPLLLALRQLADPVFAGVLLRSVLWSAAGFALLCWAAAWGTHAWLAAHGAWPGVWSWLGGAAATLLAAAAALFLFQPVAVVIATFYLERVARAVERAWYPALPEPRGATLAAQAWDGAALGVAVLALNVVALLLALLLPGVGLLLGWAVAAWAIGRGLFVAVAMRRMGREAARAAYDRRRGAVLLQGAALAAAAAVPGLNLLVPVIGVAAMVHVLNAE
jgi:CysZ protein